MEAKSKDAERLIAEEVLKKKLDSKIMVINNPDYTFNKIIEAMQEFSDQQSSQLIQEVKELKEEIERSNELLKEIVDPNKTYNNALYTKIKKHLNKK